MFGRAFHTFYNLSTKRFEIKTSTLVEQFLGASQGLPTFFSRVRVSDQRRKKGHY
jgi:hypothetical protein